MEKIRDKTISDSENEIIDIIEKMSGKYTPYVMFSDWVKMFALSIQNSCYVVRGKDWKCRENQYLDVAKKYNSTELNNFCKMNALLVAAFDENGINDYLGNIYMKSGAGSKQTGQFFTPFHLSVLTASVALKNVTKEQKIPMNEPSTGGGGMILAAAKVLQEKGINYQRCLDVTAQDLDWNGVYMTYVQLSLIGVKAIVIQGDTLSEPYVQGNYPSEKVMKTPAWMGVLFYDR